MNEQDKQAREIVRQSTARASGNRLMAGSAGVTSQPATTDATHVNGQGKVRRLFLLDHDRLDDPSKYLGSDPIPEP